MSDKNKTKSSLIYFVKQFSCNLHKGSVALMCCSYENTHKLFNYHNINNRASDQVVVFWTNYFLQLLVANPQTSVLKTTVLCSGYLILHKVFKCFPCSWQHIRCTCLWGNYCGQQDGFNVIAPVWQQRQHLVRDWISKCPLDAANTYVHSSCSLIQHQFPRFLHNISLCFNASRIEL